MVATGTPRLGIAAMRAAGASARSDTRIGKDNSATTLACGLA